MGKTLNPVSSQKFVNLIANCETASYSPIINKFLINMDSAPDFLFHEMDHAMTDKYGSFLSKLNVKSSFYSLALIPVFLTTALFKAPKKNKEDKPQGIIDKVTTFIKNNCGKLVAATFIPILIDEGVASIKGQKLAKSVLSSKKILDGLKLTNLKAYGTYALAPLLFGGLSALLVKGSDKIFHKNKSGKSGESEKSDLS